MIEVLERHRRVAADTNIFICRLDGHPQFGPGVSALFDAMERESIQLFTSAVTRLELLVKPLRLGANLMAAEIFTGLSAFPALEFVPVDVRLAARAADLRARHRLSVPDALQLATAIAAGTTAFVRHDDHLAAAEMIMMEPGGEPEASACGAALLARLTIGALP